jgi:tRNA threonylcarbamoyladenosine biosynthesis protein TsaE
MEKLIALTPEDTEEIGRRLAGSLKGKEVICLSGELGAGKTTFVRGLAKGMGIKRGFQVRSPTFTLVNVYPTDKGELIHIDLYRVQDLDIEEFLGRGVIAVEWARELDICDIRVRIEYEGEARTIYIERR